jgi:hypothetical protein
MLRRVALVRTDVSEELSDSIIRVTRIGELGTTQAATSNRRTILHSHRRENLKSSSSLIGRRVGRVPAGAKPILKHYMGFLSTSKACCNEEEWSF